MPIRLYSTIAPATSSDEPARAIDVAHRSGMAPTHKHGVIHCDSLLSASLKFVLTPTESHLRDTSLWTPLDFAPTVCSKACAALIASSRVALAITETNSPTSVLLFFMCWTRARSFSGASGNRHKQSACLTAISSASCELPPRKISGPAVRSDMKG